MGRPQEFDRDEVLEKAMDLFWQYGYEGTSMHALISHTGLQPGSIYNAFGNKHALYLAALERYCQEGTAAVTALMQQEMPVKEAFRQLFEAIVEASVNDTSRRGCFLANATIEQAPHDTETLTNVHAAMFGSVTLFEQALDRAQKRGELGARHDPHQLAHFMLNAINGLRVTAKATAERTVLENIVAVTLSVLD